MNIFRLSATFVTASILVGCAFQQVSKLPSSTEESKVPIVKETSRKQAFKVCENTQRNLKLKWQGRTYWCGPVRRHTELESLNRGNLENKITKNTQKNGVDTRPPPTILNQVLKKQRPKLEPLRIDKEESIGNTRLSKPLPQYTKTSHIEKPKKKYKYNYSVAYVYDKFRPWDEMWNDLEGVPVPDKWRGKNSIKDTFFIYAGVYNRMEHAEVRQQDLKNKTGKSPLIRKRKMAL